MGEFRFFVFFFSISWVPPNGGRPRDAKKNKKKAHTHTLARAFWCLVLTTTSLVLQHMPGTPLTLRFYGAGPYICSHASLSKQGMRSCPLKRMGPTPPASCKRLGLSSPTGCSESGRTSLSFGTAEATRWSALRGSKSQCQNQTLPWPCPESPTYHMQLLPVLSKPKPLEEQWSIRAGSKQVADQRRPHPVLCHSLAARFTRTAWSVLVCFLR